LVLSAVVGTFPSAGMSSVWPPLSASASVQLPLHQPGLRQPMFTNVASASSSSSAEQNAANPPLQPVPVLSPTMDAPKPDFQQFFSGELLLLQQQQQQQLLLLLLLLLL